MFIAIVLLLVYCLSMAVIARRKFKKIQSILFDQCDAQGYLELLSQKATKHLYVLFEFSRAYLYVGNDEEAIKSAELPKKKFWQLPRNLRWHYEFLYYNFNFLCAINTKRIAHAEEHLGEMQRIVKENASKASEVSHKSVLLSCQYIMSVVNGEYDGADIFYQTYLENLKIEGQMLSCVTWSWRLGELYTKLNKMEKAREYLELVVANGNTTRYVIHAQNLLNAYKLTIAILYFIFLQ